MHTLLISLLVLFGCTQQDSPNNQTFISLHPAITQTIFYLQSEKVLVGRSDYCLYPEEAKTLPTFGTSLSPNIEQLALQTNSTLLVDNSYSDSQNLESMMTIQRLKWLTPADMMSSIGELGTLLNVKSTAAELNEKLSKAFTPPSDTAPRVLFLMMGSDFTSGQIWYLKPNSIHGAMLEAAGYRNAMKRTDGPPQMSIEEMLLVDPDIIILLGDLNQSDNAPNQLTELKRIASLRAVANEAIKVVLLDNAYGTGPSILEHITALKSALDGLPTK